MNVTFWVIYLLVGVILVTLFVFSKKRSSWDIQPCPFEVLRQDESGDFIIVSDNGAERSLELMFSFDYGDEAGKRCYVIKRPEDEGPKRCYVFWRENPDGAFTCTLDDDLRRTVQKVFSGTARFKK